MQKQLYSNTNRILEYINFQEMEPFNHHIQKQYTRTYIAPEKNTSLN